MGQDLGGRDQDFVKEMMAQDRESNEEVTDSKDVPDITKMRDGKNIKKMENVINSTKNGHKSEVR